MEQLAAVHLALNTTHLSDFEGFVLDLEKPELLPESPGYV